MAYNIGPKIGIDGWAEFRKQIKAINTSYRTMEAELKAVSAAYDVNGDEAGKLSATTKILEREIAAQKEKLELVQDALKKTTEKYNENSVEASRLRGVMYDTQATLSGLEKKLRDTESELGDSEEAVEDLGEELEDVGKSAHDFGAILKGSFAADILSDALDKSVDLLKEFSTASIEAATDVKAANAQFEQTFFGMEKQAASTLDAVADQTGIAATRMQKSYTSLYAFSKSVGADSGKSLNIAKRAMLAAADSAAYYDKSIEDATETLQSFLKGNYENDAALGIAATETTRNAKANKMYAKSFKELSESQKVDVLLAMVEAGNKASGALGQAAREADSWANVTGELEDAQKQLLATMGEPVLKLAIPVVQNLTEVMRELAEETPGEELRRQIEDFTGSWEEAERTYQDTTAKVDATAAVAERYIRRLQELETQGLNTAEAHSEYKTVVEQLQALLPDLNLTIDEQTGLLEQNTDALLADTEAWKKKATMQAVYDRNKELLKAYGEANASLAESQQRRQQMQDQFKVLEEQIRQALNMEGELEIYEDYVTNSITSKFFRVVDKATGRRDRISASNSGVNAALSDEANQIWNLQCQMHDLDKAIADGSKVVEGYSGQIDEVTKQLAAMKEQVEGTDRAQGKASEGTEELTAEIQALKKAYDESKTAARESIDQQIGLFQELATESDWSAEKIIQNWASQREAFARYEENLKKAVDLGLDQTLVTQLSDGSEKSMLILDAMVNDTEISIDEINAAFAGMSESRDSVAGVLAGILTDADESLAELEEKARDAGSNTMDGLINGIKSKIKDLRDKMIEAANAAMDSYNDTMDQHSPSRVMEKSGEYTLDGAIVGVDNRIAAFQRKMEDAAIAGNDAFLRKRLAEVESYPTYGAGSVVNQTSTSTVRHEYGGITIQIYPRESQRANEIADEVMYKLTKMVIEEGAGLDG